MLWLWRLWLSIELYTRWVRGAGEDVAALQDLVTLLVAQVDRDTLEHGEIQVGEEVGGCVNIYEG